LRLFSEESLYIKTTFCLLSFHAWNDCFVKKKKRERSVVNEKALFENTVSESHNVLGVTGCVTPG